MRKSSKIRPAHILPLVFLLLIPGLAPCSEPLPDDHTASKSVNAFAMDLYAQLRRSEGNLIFSPYSVSMALAMTYAGARGNTESQMAKALHLSLQQKVHKEFAAVNARCSRHERRKMLR